MHMGVNAPWQDQQSLGIELTLGAFTSGEVVADFYNLLTTNTNVSLKLSLRGDNQTISDNQVLQRFCPPFVMFSPVDYITPWVEKQQYDTSFADSPT
jgi:hypothetical protein